MFLYRNIIYSFIVYLTMLVGWLRAIILSTRQPADWCIYRWSIFVRVLGHISGIEQKKQSFHNAIYINSKLLLSKEGQVAESV